MKEVRPFCFRSQYLDWDARNCGSGPCKKLQTCDIVTAIEDGTITGVVTESIAKRMGYFKFNKPKQGRFCYIWPCLEHDPEFDIKRFLSKLKEAK